MPSGLKRYQTFGHHHLITISCYRRRPYFHTPEARDLFEDSFERTRRKYQFNVAAYVVMPEHVHLLLSEPETEPLSKALQALKVSVSKKSPKGRSGKIATTTSTSSRQASSSRSAGTYIATPWRAALSQNPSTGRIPAT